jgi:hypothetical protein
LSLFGCRIVCNLSGLKLLSTQDKLDKDTKSGLSKQGGFKDWQALVRESVKVDRNLIGVRGTTSRSEDAPPPMTIEDTMRKFLIRNGSNSILNQCLGLFETFSSRYRQGLTRVEVENFDKNKQQFEPLFAGVVCFTILSMLGVSSFPFLIIARLI